jgi:hypothetical protein
LEEENWGGGEERKRGEERRSRETEELTVSLTNFLTD